MYSAIQNLRKEVYGPECSERRGILNSKFIAGTISLEEALERKSLENLFHVFADFYKVTQPIDPSGKLAVRFVYIDASTNITYYSV